MSANFYVQKFVQIFSLTSFIWSLCQQIMEKKYCCVCRAKINEDDLCETCLEFMKGKYPEKKDFIKALQWHKNHTQLN